MKKRLDGRHGISCGAPGEETLGRDGDHRAGVAVERILFQVNARTGITVGQASGLALAAAARRGIPVVHYSPNEVKLAVTGYGGADKEQVQAMVARLCNLPSPPRPPDAADALALAVCHLWAAPLRDTDHVGAATDLAVEALVGVVGPDLAPDLFGERGEGEDVG